MVDESLFAWGVFMICAALYEKDRLKRGICTIAALIMILLWGIGHL